MKKYSFVIKFLLLITIVSWGGNQLFAQSEVFRHITPRDGLPSGFVWTMMQDSKGFIWIGTNSGLARYNGYSTVTFQQSSDDSTSISGDIVSEIIEYNESTFLVATNGGFNLFNPATEEFRLVEPPNSLPKIGPVSDLLLLDEKTLWIVATNGLYLLDPSGADTGQPAMEHYPFTENDDGGVPGRNVLEADNKNNLWVGTNTKLLKFNLDSREFTDIGPVSDRAEQIIQASIWDIFFTSNNSLLISSTAGLAILEEGGNEIRDVQQIGDYDLSTISGASFQSITEDPEGKIWLGTGVAGAIHWDPVQGEATVYRASDNSSDTIASDDVHYAFEDSEGNIWFGYHFLGASIMYDDSWNYRVVTPFPELPSNDPKNIVVSTYMDDSGTIWASTPMGVIKDLGSEDQEYYGFDVNQFESIGNFQVLILAPSSLGNKLYLYAINSGNPLPLYVMFDKGNLEDPFSILELPDDASIAPGQRGVYGDFYFNPLFNRDAILRINYKTNEFDFIELPIEGDYPGATFQVSAPVFVDEIENELYVQSYWLGNADGVQIEKFILDLETNEFRKHDFEIDYPIRDIQAPMLSDYELGVLYINSSTGLIKLDNPNSSYTVLFEDQMSLLREGSRLMVEDEDGYIWLSNLTGLTRLDPLSEKIDYFEIPPDRFTSINSFPTALQNGEIIFPGSGSYVRFDPSDLSSKQPVGATIISSLQAGDDVYDLLYSSRVPEIESARNTLTFSFFGIDYRDPASISYRYRILGAENEQWTNVGTQRSVFIPNLSAGNYTFEIQSGSQFGSFNGQTASLDFSILPPWWNTIPAYLMYALLLGGLIFGADRMQRRRVIQKERERSREKELAQAREIEKAYENLKAAQEQLVQQEKLASLGQLTAGIAHEIKNPLNFVNNFSELSVELVEEVRNEIRDMRREMKGTPSEASAEDGETSKVKREKSPLEGGKDGKASQGDDTEIGYASDTEFILDILDDIEANLKTIHKHGSRADSIVKSMLQHSRGGSGKPEPTDLNALIREYANLSFHGMRAGDDPINVDVDLQLDESIGEVPLIAEDFSRVILNLTNNAFDAMAEKSRMSKVEGKKNTLRQPAESAEAEPRRGVSGYAPILTIRTHQTEKTVTVEVEDNGPGIPQDIKDKILQPFFTTKKGTAGTGLGLSITNDIVKAHGGTLEIESVPGELTRFKIILSRDQL